MVNKRSKCALVDLDQVKIWHCFLSFRFLNTKETNIFLWLQTLTNIEALKLCWGSNVAKLQLTSVRLHSVPLRQARSYIKWPVPSHSGPTPAANINSRLRSQNNHTPVIRVIYSGISGGCLETARNSPFSWSTWRAPLPHKRTFPSCKLYWYFRTKEKL